MIKVDNKIIDIGEDIEETMAMGRQDGGTGAKDDLSDILYVLNKTKCMIQYDNIHYFPSFKYLSNGCPLKTILQETRLQNKCLGPAPPLRLDLARSIKVALYSFLQCCFSHILLTGNEACTE